MVAVLKLVASFIEQRWRRRQGQCHGTDEQLESGDNGILAVQWPVSGSTGVPFRLLYTIVGRVYFGHCVSEQCVLVLNL